jgi:hypothetical protein
MEQLEARIKELKKSKFDVESIVSKATALPFPQEDQLFSATTALQRNVVFLGVNPFCFMKPTVTTVLTPRQVRRRQDDVLRGAQGRVLLHAARPQPARYALEIALFISFISLLLFSYVLYLMFPLF